MRPGGPDTHTLCLWQALATMVREERASSQPSIKTSYLGASREAGWGYCLSSHHRQVAGMSPPQPPHTAEGLSWVEGVSRCSRRKLLPSSVPKAKRYSHQAERWLGVSLSLRGPFEKGPGDAPARLWKGGS